MLTRWGKVASSILRSGTNIYSPVFDFASSPNIATGSFKDVTGTAYFFAPYPSGSVNLNSLSTSLTSAGIIVGSGTTTPTVDDYSLESMITSGITGSIPANPTYTFDSTNNQYVVSKDITIANTGSEAITISEIGILGKVYYGASKGATVGTTNKYVLIDRTVLNEAVTIPAGESGVVRYEIRYDCDFTKPET